MGICNVEGTVHGFVKGVIEDTAFLKCSSAFAEHHCLHTAVPAESGPRGKGLTLKPGRPGLPLLESVWWPLHSPVPASFLSLVLPCTQDSPQRTKSSACSVLGTLGVRGQSDLLMAWGGTWP